MAKEEMGAYKRKGAAESKYLSEDGDVIDENKKTAGPAEFGGKKGDDSKSKKDYEGPGKYAGKKGDDSKSKKDYEGPGKGKMHMSKKVDGPGRSSGYTQNFGPARVNGYAKGAAKVNSIMGKGPAEGFFDTIKKVGRTGVDIAKSVGAQALDMISPDPIRSSYFSMGDFRSAKTASKGAKETEQNILDRVQNRSDSGSTYPISGMISQAFNDTGYGRNIFGGDEFGNYTKNARAGKPGPTSSRTANSPGIFRGLEVNSPSGTSAYDVDENKRPISPNKNKPISRG
jgi:hypothetical protein